MKNITLSADETLIQLARRKAQSESSSLNERFRAWLQQYVGTNNADVRYEELMNDLTYVVPGRSFTRDEMNER